MSIHRGYRVLTVGEHVYLWRVRHLHDEGCDEVLSIRRVDSPSGRALHFRPKPGFCIPAGGTSAAGVVGDDTGRWLNLNEPGVVRAVVDVLTASDWPIGDRSFAHLDGWSWFGSVSEHDRQSETRRGRQQSGGEAAGDVPRGGEH